MQRGIQGTLIKSTLTAGEAYNTYIPSPLPPIPEIEMSEVASSFHLANFAIFALNDIVDTVPDTGILNYMYMRKEAVLSSQIEGTQSTLDDLLRYESEYTKGVAVDDVNEVSSYVAALNYGMKRIEDGFPMSMRLVKEIHKILLENSRGANKTPGEFRRSQNWIGGSRPGNARFVPAPPDKVVDLMSDLEKFLHSYETPVLFRAALMHHQLETIHPFLDGNGRVGRLLITLFLQWQGYLVSPFLYLSLYFKKNRSLYYEKLNTVRDTGDWEDWINFFFEGIAETANDARKTLLAIKKTFTKADEKIAGLGRPRISAAKVMSEFKRKPLLTISEIVKRTGLSNNAVLNTINRLVILGLIKGVSERKWGQLYSFSEYASILSADTELI